MEILLEKLVQPSWEATNQWREVSQLADKLCAHLNTPKARSLIYAANQPGVSSGVVQATFLEFATELGFSTEKTGLFESIELGLRPDYYRELEDTGILLEVERGKTTINNMDLLDFWKCHICANAHYLYLIVPKALRQNETMVPRNEFATVSRRLAHFFIPDNYTNVRGLCLYGY